MKYVKKFNTHSDYNTYITGDPVLPNVSYCEDNNDVHYNQWYDPERFVAKFNITTTTSTTSLFNNPTLLSKIEIDGVEYSGNDIYSHTNHTFNTTGIHTVKYTLVDGTTIIDGGSFSGKSNMISITIPNTITTIGSSAFGGCGSLTSVTIPNSVTTIIGSPFQGCSKLTSVTIPSSVTTISGSFCNCIFEDVIFETINPNATFVVDTTNKCIISDDGTVLLAGFNNTVAIPNTVTSIADYAFGWCYGLTSVTIPNSVTTIDGGAFYNCTGLTNITIPNSVTTIDGGAFYNCTGLTNITIPNSVTSIGSSAFYGCTSLTSVTIPNSVTTIGQSAFLGCSGLTSVTIGSGITAIGGSAFKNCTGLTSIGGVGSGASLEIPSNVTKFTVGAFQDCTGLTSVTIPSSLTSISTDAFVGCSGLTSIVVDSGNAFYDSRNNCNAIIKTTTNTLNIGCQNTVIPSSVTSIGYHAFEKCSNLTSITIPNSVTSIGNTTFSGCSGLTSITSLATTAPTINTQTFQNVKTGGTLYVPSGSTGYDVWMGTGNYYLGKYSWTKVEQ